MSDADFHRDRSSSQILGKEFMIVVVVVFSALSFTLGYFVGKSGADRKTKELSHAQEIVPLPQRQEPAIPPQAQDAPAAENAPLLEEEAKEPLQPLKKQAAVIVETKESEPAKNSRQVKEKSRSQTELQQISEEDRQGPAAKNNSLSTESKKSAGPVYTVQIGAFKSSGEAEAFGKKQAKNKVKTYITTAANAKKEKIYKVKTGEFRDKKSAEVLALKLSKTGKLKTFVTLKNE